MKNNKNIFLLIAIIILSLGLLYYVLFVNKDTVKFFGSNPITQQIQKNYPTFDERLNKVVRAQNRMEEAQKENLAADKTGIKVLIKLKKDSFFLTSDYGVQQLRYGKNVQATIKYDRLEALAKNPNVESVIAPQNVKLLFPLKALTPSPQK